MAKKWSPGDIIPFDYINNLENKVSELRKKIAALEKDKENDSKSKS